MIGAVVCRLGAEHGYWMMSECQDYSWLLTIGLLAFTASAIIVWWPKDW